MQAVFFGRTSNGKSTLINAMMSNKLLPTGFGHTTNCFLRIRGADTETGYVQPGTESDTRMDISDLKQLAHALYTEGTDCEPPPPARIFKHCVLWLLLFVGFLCL